MPGDAVVLKARREGAVLITVVSTGARGRRQLPLACLRLRTTIDWQSAAGRYGFCFSASLR